MLQMYVVYATFQIRRQRLKKQAFLGASNT